MMLLLVSAIGLLIGDVKVANSLVLDNFHAGFSTLAPWIFKSIEEIISAQLKGPSQNI